MKKKTRQRAKPPQGKNPNTSPSNGKGQENATAMLVVLATLIRMGLNDALDAIGKKKYRDAIESLELGRAAVDRVIEAAGGFSISRGEWELRKAARRG